MARAGKEAVPVAAVAAVQTAVRPLTIASVTPGGEEAGRRGAAPAGTHRPRPDPHGRVSLPVWRRRAPHGSAAGWAQAEPMSSSSESACRSMNAGPTPWMAASAVRPPGRSAAMARRVRSGQTV